MRELRYTLVPDGSSDEALLPILTWLLKESGVSIALAPRIADFRHLREAPRTLTDRIVKAVDLFECDLLFVHRDAETQTPGSRHSEIRKALEAARERRPIPDVVCVVPVRMTEAFLLFDEQAIRRAAGNPNGNVALDLPAIARCQGLPDPKETLYQILRDASELTGRRRESSQSLMLLGAWQERSTTSLRFAALTSFSTIEQDVVRLVREKGWSGE